MTGPTPDVPVPATGLVAIGRERVSGPAAVIVRAQASVRLAAVTGLVPVSVPVAATGPVPVSVRRR